MGLKRVPKIRFSHLTTHFDLIPRTFAAVYASGMLKTSLPVHCANLPAAYWIGAGVSKHNELILLSLTYFGRKIGLR
jgi:hypothetical protein